MKTKALLLSTLLFLPLPAFAGGPVFRRVNSNHGQTNVYEECFRHVEKYTPGHYNSRGQYVRGQVRVTKESVPCRRSRPRQEYREHPNTNIDDNSCIEGSVLGGILGGGIGAAASRGDGRWWAIPAGVVGGAMVGCQIDGG
jgi:hypothetical protein|tara:strand:- start:90 stop:512 length:423 start_codon:yes stop_codon:yes gene_type:complete